LHVHHDLSIRATDEEKSGVFMSIRATDEEKSGVFMQGSFFAHGQWPKIVLGR
jgi:hypothetical protein